ncbi:hypothetical protein L227DRAFT_521513 [Lentinus tigrinus ALCF2SS1-6]|uniref:Uncharacterized protein n=1 Tax=Lentinus tigrinus ALCF2SS1-6 TaxID=1328759 RepID=A0A5C2SPI9_9APHY|nr:hypothetical protein L227DRAFT_521513 [Lentinus tigrinus ALCF2SS1-6]
MKTIAAATLFASVALAQSASLIPSGISTSCTTYLNKFNSDTSLASCTSSVITATSAYSPSLNSTASSSVSATGVKSSLAALCSASSCSDSTIRSALADFYEACNDELTTNANQDVIRTYDVLYALTPLKNALCAKDESNNYCLTDIANTTSQSTSVLSTVAKYISIPIAAASSALSRRADAQAVAAIAPNATTFASNNILFLMLQPDLSSDKLCQSCTRSVITSYISFESSTPYAPGLAQSALLAGQSDLYQAVQKTCGSTFLSGAVAAAAGLSGGIVGQASDSGASRSILANTGIAGVAVGAIALVLGAAF